MKAKNLNNSSKKTRKKIKLVFTEMLSEKKELGKITVSELCQRAEISRGAFYSHYDDIYSVAQDYEDELIDHFFDNTRLLSLNTLDQFIDLTFEYIRENDGNYRLLCKSNDLLFAAKKLTNIATGKFLELCYTDSRIKNKTHLALEISIFIEGLFCEYIKYCREYSDISLDDLYAYTKQWVTDFMRRRTAPQET